MSSVSERRQLVAEMRSRTRAYIADRRRGRMSMAETSQAEPTPEEMATFAFAPDGILPDPAIAALSPLTQAAEPAAVDGVPLASPEKLPLGALKIFGPGMIWRLNNLGLQTIGQLGACDPKRLGEALGPVGRLLRTEAWVEAAREMLARA